MSSILLMYSKASSSISFVRRSTKKEPPRGSMVFATPDSSAIICWVRRAMVAASSVGNARASSRELVCNDCVPPSTAARASRAVLIILL